MTCYMKRFLKMEIGEPVYFVSSFPNQPAILAFGCESGKLVVKDIETNKSVYENSNSDSIIIVRTTDEHTIFAATEEQVFCHDLREGYKPKMILKSPSEISDFVVNGDLFVIATYSNDIILSDKRVFRKSQSAGILPSVCSSLAFQDSKNLVAGYLDTTSGIWNLTDAKFNPFASVKSEQFNPSVVHSVATYTKSSQSSSLFTDNFTAVARQTGLCVYKNEKLVINSLLEHEGAVQVVTFAECFDTPHTVSGAADGSLMVFDCTNLKPLDCLSIENEKIESITSNSRIIAVADTSDNGNIGIFTPDDFLNPKEEEEEGKEKENEKKE